MRRLDGEGKSRVLDNSIDKKYAKGYVDLLREEFCVPGIHLIRNMQNGFVNFLRKEFSESLFHLIRN